MTIYHLSSTEHKKKKLLRKAQEFLTFNTGSICLNSDKSNWQISNPSDLEAFYAFRKNWMDEKVNVNLVPMLDKSKKVLLVCDLDSTLIQLEVIDEMARIAGPLIYQKVKEVTASSMAGKRDFAESFRLRISLLKGFHAETIFSQIKANIPYTIGAEFLVSELKKRMDLHAIIISGGMTQIVQIVGNKLQFDNTFSNCLEVDSDGLFTGKMAPGWQFVDAQGKRKIMEETASALGISQIIAIGDGANDIPMLSAASHGIAFCSKPIVKEHTKIHLDIPDLSLVLPILGEYDSQKCSSLQKSISLLPYLPFLIVPVMIAIVAISMYRKK